MIGRAVGESARSPHQYAMHQAIHGAQDSCDIKRPEIPGGVTMRLPLCVGHTQSLFGPNLSCGVSRGYTTPPTC
jgi:hypothetical protein